MPRPSGLEIFGMGDRLSCWRLRLGLRLTGGRAVGAGVLLGRRRGGRRSVGGLHGGGTRSGTRRRPGRRHWRRRGPARAIEAERFRHIRFLRPRRRTVDRVLRCTVCRVLRTMLLGAARHVVLLRTGTRRGRDFLVASAFPPLSLSRSRLPDLSLSEHDWNQVQTVTARGIPDLHAG